MTLVEKLEKATGASRELDMEIATAVGHTPGPPNFDLTSPRRYTASIDAALTLVESGCFVELKFGGSEGRARDWCHAMIEDAETGQEHDAQNAATPAIALVIAALRARQHGEG